MRVDVVNNTITIGSGFTSAVVGYVFTAIDGTLVLINDLLLPPPLASEVFTVYGLPLFYDETQNATEYGEAVNKLNSYTM
jgi:hypothetical protein